MAVNRTSLSAGSVIRAALLANEAVAARVNKIFPVVTDRADLPYILYRHAKLSAIAARGAVADTVEVELQICTEKYAEGIELAEAVRAVLDGATLTHNGLTLRHCMLVDFESTWDAGAHIQVLTLSAKIA